MTYLKKKEEEKMIAINLHSQKEPKKTKYYGKVLRKKQLLKESRGKMSKNK